MTLVELWTGVGAGGVAVVALRGSGARERLARLGVRAGSAGPRGSGPRLVRLRDGDEDLDEALLVEVDRGLLELHLHGSPPLVERVLGLLRAPAGGAAAVGDDRGHDASSELGFAERTWRRLASAPSELGARILLDQAQGAFENEVARLGQFGADALRRAAAELLERGRIAHHLLQRSTVAIVGPVNAGKSTLFNLLLGTQRTVVSAERGTTRDAIPEHGRLGPWPILLVDTAGQRELPGTDARHAVERAGQRLAQAVGEEADWVLELARVRPEARHEAPPTAGPMLTCCDELGDDPGSWPAGGVSALKQPEDAVARVRQRFEARFDLPSDPQLLWSPGRAVPVEVAQRRVLERLASGPEGQGAADPPQDPEVWLRGLRDLSR